MAPDVVPGESVERGGKHDEAAAVVDGERAKFADEKLGDVRRFEFGEAGNEDAACRRGPGQCNWRRMRRRRRPFS